MGMVLGFYPGSKPGEQTHGTAASFDQARADFERAWMMFSARRTKADYEEWREQRELDRTLIISSVVRVRVYDGTMQGGGTRISSFSRLFTGSEGETCHWQRPDECWRASVRLQGGLSKCFSCPLHRRRRGVLDLDPVRTPSGTISPVPVLRHDPFKPKLARMLKHSPGFDPHQGRRREAPPPMPTRRRSERDRYYSRMEAA